MNVPANRRGVRGRERTGHVLSTRSLAALGMSQLAYIKHVTVDGKAAFAIHAADGTPMALTDNRDLALAAILQHEMVPALVH